MKPHPPGRPDHRPIPLDSIHAFFQDPLKRSDPVVAVWRHWFIRTRVKFRTRRFLGARVQFYVHRCLVRGNRTTWCCGPVQVPQTRWWVSSPIAERGKSSIVTDPEDEGLPEHEITTMLSEEIVLPEPSFPSAPPRSIKLGGFSQDELTKLEQIYGPISLQRGFT